MRVPITDEVKPCRVLNHDLAPLRRPIRHEPVAPSAIAGAGARGQANNDIASFERPEQLSASFPVPDTHLPVGGNVLGHLGPQDDELRRPRQRVSDHAAKERPHSRQPPSAHHGRSNVKDDKPAAGIKRWNSGV